MEIYSTTLKKSQGRRTIEGGEDDESSGDQLCSLLGIKPLKRLRSGGEANPAAIHHLKYAPFVETRRETRELFSPSLSFSFSFSRLSLSLFFPFSFFPFLSPSLFRHHPCLILTFSRGDAFLFHLLLHLLLSLPPGPTLIRAQSSEFKGETTGAAFISTIPSTFLTPRPKVIMPPSLSPFSFFLSFFLSSISLAESANISHLSKWNSFIETIFSFLSFTFLPFLFSLSLSLCLFGFLLGFKWE